MCVCAHTHTLTRSHAHTLTRVLSFTLSFFFSLSHRYVMRSEQVDKDGWQYALDFSSRWSKNQVGSERSCDVSFWVLCTLRSQISRSICKFTPTSIILIMKVPDSICNFTLTESTSCSVRRAKALLSAQPHATHSTAYGYGGSV
jgi:hypothetical protein